MDTQIFAYTLSGEPVELGFSLGKFFRRVAKKTTKLAKKVWIPVRNATVKALDTAFQKYTGIKPSSIFKHGRESAPVQITRSRYGTPIVPPPERHSPQTPQTQPHTAAMMNGNMLPLLLGAGIALYMWRKR